MKQTYILFLLVTFISCSGQNPSKVKQLGGPCDGCEAVYEYGDKKLSSIDTLPGFKENEPKLKISGTVYERDGKTAAKNVILYIYHTDRNGVYPKRGNESGWARKHGYIRSWVKTGENGRYTFYTFRPAAYPNRLEAEHVHMTVKETGKSEYYIDNFHFDDDPLLTDEKRKRLPERGGPGIMKPVSENGILIIRRDIILGLNIPDYD